MFAGYLTEFCDVGFHVVELLRSHGSKYPRACVEGYTTEKGDVAYLSKTKKGHQNLEN